MRITVTYRGLRPLVRYEPRTDQAANGGTATAQLTLPLPTGTRRGRATLPVRTSAPVPPLAPEVLHRMFTAILEAYDGKRPPEQLRGFLDPLLYQRLTAPRQREYRGYRLHRPPRAQYPMPWVIEACATVRAGEARYGIAARFECPRETSRWRCTLFDLVTDASTGSGREG